MVEYEDSIRLHKEKNLDLYNLNIFYRNCKSFEFTYDFILSFVLLEILPTLVIKTSWIKKLRDTYNSELCKHI